MDKFTNGNQIYNIKFIFQGIGVLGFWGGVAGLRLFLQSPCSNTRHAQFFVLCLKLGIAEGEAVDLVQRARGWLVGICAWP